MASEQDQADLAFPSSSAQGIYNATIGQLNTLTNSEPPIAWLPDADVDIAWPSAAMAVGGYRNGHLAH